MERKKPLSSGPSEIGAQGGGQSRADIAKPGFINSGRDAAASLGAKGVLKSAATPLSPVNDMQGAKQGGRRRQRRHIDLAWPGRCRYDTPDGERIADSSA